MVLMKLVWLSISSEMKCKNEMYFPLSWCRMFQDKINKTFAAILDVII